LEHMEFCNGKRIGRGELGDVDVSLCINICGIKDGQGHARLTGFESTNPSSVVMFHPILCLYPSHIHQDHMKCKKGTDSDNMS